MLEISPFADYNPEYTPGTAQELESVTQYLDSIKYFGLLTAEQEVELAKRIEAGTAAEILEGFVSSPNATEVVAYRSWEQNRSIGVPSGDRTVQDSIEIFTSWIEKTSREERLRLIQDGQNASRDMIEGNLKLVYHFAKHFVEYNVSMEDILSYGNTSLIRAAYKFDYRQGYKFSTYAAFWIKKFISKGIKDEQAWELDDPSILSLNFLCVLPDRPYDDGIVLVELLKPRLLYDTYDEVPENTSPYARLLNAVPPRERAILNMHFLYQQDAEQIALTMGFKPAWVRTLLRRTVAKLREQGEELNLEK